MSQPPNPEYPGGPGQQPPPPWGPPPAGYSQAPPGYAPPPPYGSPLPSARPGFYTDQGSGLMLPEGTQLASIGRRIGAYFLAIPLAIVTLGIGYLIWGLVVWGRGQTPALQVLGMRCYRPTEGKPAGWGSMALREVVGRFLEGILSVITYLISFVLFLTRSDRRALHDLVAGTVVLYDPAKTLSR